MNSNYRHPPIIKALIAIIIPIAKLLFRYEIKGVENLPKNGGCVYASNHISFLDPVLWVISTKRRIRYMAKAELFNNRFLSWILKKAGAFPVNRGKNAAESVSYAIDIVKDGGILGIFPEGTRSKDGTPKKGKAGVAYIANATEADIIPMAIITKGKVRPFKKIKLVIGKPILHSEIHFEGSDRAGLKKASQTVMSEIEKLWKEGQNEL